MEHVSYGLFDDEGDARAAIEAVEASGMPRQRMGVTLHRGRLDEGLLGVGETDAAEGAREGAAIAGIVTARSWGPWSWAPWARVGRHAGRAVRRRGGVRSAGFGSPDRNLEQLSKHLAEGKLRRSWKRPASSRATRRMLRCALVAGASSTSRSSDLLPTAHRTRRASAGLRVFLDAAAANSTSAVLNSST